MMLKAAPAFLLILLSLMLFLGCGNGDTTSDDDSTKASDDDDDDAAGDDDSVDDDDDATDDDDDDDNDDDDDDDITPMGDPTQPGSYPVGHRTLVLVDESRGDPATQDLRTLVTEIWYPAVDEAATMDHDKIRNFLDPWADMILQGLVDYGASEDDMENFERETGAVRDAQPATKDAPFPLLVFSHGLAGTRFQNYTMCNYLASHGFVIVAPDHTGNAIAAPLPEGPVEFNENLVFISYWQRKGDLKFLITSFEALNENDPDGFFTGKIDTENVGTMGHSFGGTVAVETAKDDLRISAAANMASFMFPWFTDPFDGSLMFMIAQQDGTMGEVTALMRLDYAISPAPAFKLEIFDAGHYTYSDTCILLPSLMGEGDGCGEGNRRWTDEPFTFIGHDEGFGIINPYLTAFYGFNLRNDQGMADFLAAPVDSDLYSWMRKM